MLYPYSDQNSAQRPSTSQSEAPSQIWYKVVAHTRKGQVYHGLCNTLNKDSPSLEIFLHDKKGVPLDKCKVIPLDKLKALFVVKDFDGHPATTAAKVVASPPIAPIALEFTDGETIVGRPMDGQWQTAARILLRPEDTRCNNMLLVADRTSIKSISSLEVYKLKRQQDFNDFGRKHFKPGMSQEECIGDYYFSKIDYWRASEYYGLALEHTPSNSRVRSKLCVSKYNIGMHHIRNKEYLQALHYMELVLELEPGNTWAIEKARQIREHVRVNEELKNVRHRTASSNDTTLMDCFVEGAWVKRRQHFILTGLAHCGKTRLACSLGSKMSKQAMEVVYYRVPDLIKQILAIKKDGRDIQILRAMENADFLILDDWNTEILPDEEREEFLEIIADRYKRRATLLIAELPDNAWHRIFGRSTASNPKLNQVLYDALKVHLDK